MAESNQVENTPAEIVWTEAETARSALWRSENGMNPPKRVVVADDSMRADDAYRLACEGTGILWRGDFQNARQLVQAMGRRSDRKQPPLGATPAETFHLQRRAKGLRARTLSMVLIEVGADFGIGLRRAPDLMLACAQAYGTVDAPFVTSLRELLGVSSAHQWRLKGVEVPALAATGTGAAASGTAASGTGASGTAASGTAASGTAASGTGASGTGARGAAGRVYPHYGVFSPARGEYVDLVAQAPLPGRPGSESSLTAMDLGTGTGVLAAVLAQRGVGSVVGTESNQRAIVCARENIERLGLTSQITVVEGDVFPPADAISGATARADVIVCNPPWIPARPTALIEQGVYDLESRMLRRFLAGLPERLADGGEGWLILSDLAERLGLRAESDLSDLIDAAGLRVLDKLDTAPRHPRAADTSDPLHAQRAAEVTSLWRLALEG